MCVVCLRVRLVGCWFLCVGDCLCGRLCCVVCVYLFLCLLDCVVHLHLRHGGGKAEDKWIYKCLYIYIFRSVALISAARCLHLLGRPLRKGEVTRVG